MDLKNMNYPISVCVPMYNASAYLRECIDSILGQTFSDFELLIIDDGSTDESRNIIRSYQDVRIRLIESSHDYINTLNLLLKEAKGKYIARMDADDIMLPDRLEVQYNYMEAHPETDILGCGMYYMGESEKLYANQGVVTIQDLLSGNYIANPTVMMRRDSIRKANIQYDEKFKYAEDYHFWVQAAMSGLCMLNLDKPVLKYRSSSGQTSSVHSLEQYKRTKEVQSVLSRWLARDEAIWADSHPCNIPDTSNKLTVIIPFLNEKEEVGNTVRSIRATVGDQVDIIVINDQSNDGYNYRKDILPFHVTYVYNKERKGVAASRDYGVNLCKTPYFILLDAHMRFYDTWWVDRIVSMLEQDDRCLLCCQTRLLVKNQKGEIVVKEKRSRTFGACIQFDKNSYIPGVIWNYIEKNKNERTQEIAAVLGAGYAASTRYWKYLRGLEGLRYYGSDEAFISLKVWLEGGKCLLLKDLEIGHLYRNNAPYKRYNEEEVFNSLYISYLLFPSPLNCMSNAIALLKNRHIYTLANVMILEHREEIEEAKSYYNKILTNSFDSILRMQIKSGRYDTELIETYKNRIVDFNRYVCQHVPDNYGIFNGKTAVLMWMCHYAAYTNDDTYLGKAEDLLDTIKQAVYNEELSWNFCNGISGIGWAIIYLYSRGFITEKLDKILDVIDKSIKILNLKELQDFSLATGLGGIFAYLSLRIQYADPFTHTYKAKLQSIATHLINHSKELSSCYYAMLFMAYSSGDNKQSLRVGKEGQFNKYSVSLTDWISCPLFLPADSCYWDMSLAKGCMGTLLQIMCFDMANY